MTTEEGDENERKVGARVKAVIWVVQRFLPISSYVLLMWGLSENCESGTELDVFSDVRWEEGMTLI